MPKQRPGSYRVMRLHRQVVTLFDIEWCPGGAPRRPTQEDYTQTKSGCGGLPIESYARFKIFHRTIELRRIDLIDF